ncbi:aminoacyl-tRNA hydrolase [Candidatus Blochmanniella vafra]|uniref:aminoacyl-tRNA hydrolase n=1 Tax=Candidatus Blochmanniella vafra TaxID=251535 RepID=UPI0002E0B5D3|nr:aminoacyl-tRNA hydrolase [Candidatus Blochmannia vafer]
MTIKLIVGIGNIGAEYINTRHSIGHRYIHMLTKKYKVNLKLDKILSGFIGSLTICKSMTVQLLIPNSYINESGLAVYKYMKLYRLDLKELLVVHDELDLSPGMIRIKLGNKLYESHRGIQNIINNLSNQYGFYRLRIGIGRPKNKNEIVNFVLSSPSIHEKKKLILS